MEAIDWIIVGACVVWTVVIVYDLTWRELHNDVWLSVTQAATLSVTAAILFGFDDKPWIAVAVSFVAVLSWYQALVHHLTKGSP